MASHFSCPFSGGAGGKGTWGAPGDELFAEGGCRDANDPNYDSDTQVHRLATSLITYSL